MKWLNSVVKSKMSGFLGIVLDEEPDIIRILIQQGNQIQKAWRPKRAFTKCRRLSEEQKIEVELLKKEIKNVESL